MLIDAHCHLEFFDDVDSVIERARKAGVVAIIASGLNPERNRQALGIAAAHHSIVRAALGIYPADALRIPQEELKEELAFIEGNKNKIAAIAEIGLDLEEADNLLRQVEVFEMQLKLARRLGKPVVVHSRKAEKEVVDVLSRHPQVTAVMHAFHGSAELAKKSGLYYTIAANIGRSDHLQRLVQELPMSRLLTETDAPFLAPEKGGRSEPADVALAVRKIAEIKGLDEGEVQRMIFANYQRVFGTQ